MSKPYATKVMIAYPFGNFSPEFVQMPAGEVER